MTTDVMNPYQGPDAQTAIDEDTYTPKIFSFHGRLGRMRYLAYLMLSYFASYAVLIPAMMLIGGGMEGSGGLAAVGWLIYAVAMIFGVVAAFTLAKRRLNDLDKSGWLSLILVVPLVNMIFGLYLLFARGTEGSNDYGPEPEANSTWHFVVGLSLPIIGIIGIIAAVVIPILANTH